MTVQTTGVVTFLFTDIEGSTRLWEQEPEAMKTDLARHDHLLTSIVDKHGGHLFKHTGDGLLTVFETPSQAMAAATAAQIALAAERWQAGPGLKARMAIHTGEAEERNGDFFGPAVNRAARLRDAAHGGQILVSESTAGLVQDSMITGTRLIDLGEHRLKDLARAERIYQLSHRDLEPEFPSLRSLEALPNNLPVQLTSFVGRDRQLAEVKRLLDDHRLVTLTGVGGVGKTRLALQAGADLLDRYRHGVWLVELAPLTEPDLLPKTIASALAIREDPNRPITETLIDYLEERRALIILDNCEHLIDPVARLAERLLRSSAFLHILATSREGLAISGERLWQVPVLASPGEIEALDHLPEYEAVRLFLDRARAVRPDFELTEENADAVSEICRRLDGIALAIELAAARLRVFSVQQVADRLDDRFRLLTGGSRTALPRQRTLAATMDWSFDLLSEQAQLLLRRLSVFQGGFTYNAAEGVCSGDRLDEAAVLDLLTELVEESLLLVEQGPETRYRMLETVRQYSQDKLTDSGEADGIRLRHALYMLDIARRGEAGLLGKDQATWVRTLQEERGNVRVALAWARDAGRPDIGLGIARWMGRFWWQHGPFPEGRRWLELMLSEASEEPSSDRAEALRWTAMLALHQGDLVDADVLAHRSFDTYDAAGDATGRGLGMIAIAFVSSARGDLDSAIAKLQEALETFETLDEPFWASIVLANLESMVRKMGDPERSAGLAQKMVANAQRLNDERLEALGRSALAVHALRRGNLDEFRAEYRRSLACYRTSGQQLWRTQGTVSVAWSALSMGYTDIAEELIDEFKLVAEESHYPAAPAVLALMHGLVSLYKGELVYADGQLDDSLRLFEESGMLEEAIYIPVLRGQIALARGDLEAAEGLGEKALNSSTDLGATGSEIVALQLLGKVHIHREDPNAPRNCLARALERAHKVSDFEESLTTVEAFAQLYRLEGRYYESARHYAAADHLRDQVRLARTWFTEMEYQASVGDLRRELGEEVFDQAVVEGHQMTLEDLVEQSQQSVGSVL
ncbi:MAG: adenylate/guanylate cyclase domain-containing protein [Acidimicrobiia bacterium]|nr:adenylate/guanylate cyclase domain-containing protein [Acidimicrobiia bacterium]